MRLGGVRRLRPLRDSEGFLIGRSSKAWKRNESKYSSGTDEDAIAGAIIYS